MNDKFKAETRRAKGGDNHIVKSNKNELQRSGIAKKTRSQEEESLSNAAIFKESIY